MATASSGYAPNLSKADPYNYQPGFGNRFSSEALPGVLPIGCNTPQKIKYDLVSESLNGTGFIASRAEVKNVWLYRIYPTVAHESLEKMAETPDIEANFSQSNPKVHTTPVRITWQPFVPEGDGPVDFIDSLRTICGSGEPTDSEGLAIHIYACTKSMQNRAFSSIDGEMMIIPCEGRLDIQTELGHLMIKPGEFAVIPKGHRFSVKLPDGLSRGYIQEVYGVSYELPDLGVVGTNGLALPRDFETPVASFDLDQSDWEIVYKMGGELFHCYQDHTPYDVVAWHGNYCPYKYNLNRFITIGSLDKDQMDPTIYCVLKAKSKHAGVAVAEFNAFIPKWQVTTNTFRPPYYHRHLFTEIGGLIYGPERGVSHSNPGGLTYQPPFGPHGLTEVEFDRAVTDVGEVGRIGEGMIGFQFHIGRTCTVTDYAMKRSDKLEIDDRKHWAFKGGFFKNLNQVNADLESKGLPALRSAITARDRARHVNGINGTNGVGH